MLKKNLPDYTSSRMPEGTVYMFITYIQKRLLYFKMLSHATPPVGCMKAQEICLFLLSTGLYHKDIYFESQNISGDEITNFSQLHHEIQVGHHFTSKMPK